MARTRKAASALPYGALDREHLVKHLLELARRVGVDQVTMRNLAAEAGTSPSSVYYHVTDKAALLDLLVNSVLEDIEVPTDGDWVQRLRQLYTNAWHAMIDIPGIAALIQQRPLTGAADSMDRICRSIMAEAGWAAADVDGAHAVLYIHLLGSVQLAHHLRLAGSNDGQQHFEHGLRVILTGLKSCATPPDAIDPRRPS